MRVDLGVEPDRPRCAASHDYIVTVVVVGLLAAARHGWRTGAREPGRRAGARIAATTAVVRRHVSGTLPAVADGHEHGTARSRAVATCLRDARDGFVTWPLGRTGLRRSVVPGDDARAGTGGDGGSVAGGCGGRRQCHPARCAPGQVGSQSCALPWQMTACRSVTVRGNSVVRVMGSRSPVWPVEAV